MRTFHRFVGKRVVKPTREQDSKIVKHGKDTCSQVTLFSVDGELGSTRELVPPSGHRASVYQPVTVGKPLALEFLRFRLQSDQWESASNELVISTYLKAIAARPQAAETIAYFDKDARPNGAGVYELSDWGGKNYGHPLIYYTRAYMGESLFFTLQVSELDRVNTEILEVAKRAVDTVGSLPVFSAMVPYLSTAKSAMSIAGGIADWLQSDEEIIPFYNIDLHSPLVAGNRLLQSGRFVCIPDCSVDEDGMARRWKLTREHRLVDKETNEEFFGSYVVIKVNSEKQPAYEKFTHLLDTARWMEGEAEKEANTQWLPDILTMVQLKSDLDVIKQIEDVRFDFAEETAPGMLYALWQHLSPESKSLFANRFQEIMDWRQKGPMS